MKLEVIPVTGLPEIGDGDDLARLLVTHADIHDGDVLVVAQKVVSKSEGRMIEIDPTADAKAERARVAAAETARVVARRGDVVIAQTHHGFVCANAGVDASNVPPGTLALLPRDPDGSAERLRASLNSAGIRAGVVISDTFGRPWRVGQTNVALGVAGIRAVRDHRGEKDSFGMELEATIIAIADEIAGAAELVMGKSDGIPVAIVRGIEGASGEGTGSELIRPAEEDLFFAAGVDVVEMRRSVRVFAERPVPDDVVARAIRAAGTAPAPHGSRGARPWRFVWLKSTEARPPLLDALRATWRADLISDGTDEETIARRLRRSDEILATAPVLIACFVSLAAADSYEEERRARAERDMFIAAGGAAVQNLMVALAAQAVGSCWISSSLFAPDAAARALGLGTEWHALGCVAAGYAQVPPPPRFPTDSQEILDIR